MKNCVKGSKRILAGIVAGSITAAVMLAVIPSKAETAEKYPYTLFAASHDDGAITFNSELVNINGNVFTNGTVVSPGEVSIDGTLCENADSDMIYIFDRIEEKYFSGASLNEVENDYISEEEQINIDTPMVISGETSLTGEINVDSALKSLEDVTLKGDVKNKNNSLIFSKYGDISIEYEQLNLNGLIYAPKGTVTIKADSLTLNSVVIIADKIKIDCPVVNISYGHDAGQFVGCSSEGEYRSESTEAYLSIPSGDDYTDTDEGISCVKNQILVTAEPDVPYCDVEAYFNKYGAKIVGYIAVSNDYQIELPDSDTDITDLITEDCAEDRRFEFVSLNTVTQQNSDYIPSDSVLSAEDWNENVPSGLNWNLEAINAPSAWDYVMQMGTTARTGLIDGMFDTDHEDLSFKKVWNNPPMDEVMKNEHGTHVSGIMAADFNNGRGISGISAKNELYAYSVNGSCTDPQAAGIFSTVMEYKYALALLVSNNVKVINFSQNNGRLQCFAASHGNENAINYIRTNAEILQRFVEKLIDNGYEFTIVTAAGNVNNLTYRKDSASCYGYVTDSSGTEKGGALAEFNSFFNYPYSEKVKERTICVGSFGLKSDGNGSEYRYSPFSNVGDRVDVAAPGEDIISTVPGSEYKILSGTSMSAAHVSGEAGLLYSMNPGFTGEEVKRIIVKSSGSRTVTDAYAGNYGLIDAQKAIANTISTAKVNEEHSEANGVIIGRLCDEKNNPAAGAEVSARRIDENNAVSAETASSSVSDLSGNFELVLAPGRYRVSITADTLSQQLYDISVTEGDAQYFNWYLENDSSDSIASDENENTDENSSADQYRIELVWDSDSADLDSHLTGPSDEGRFHVYFTNTGYSDGNGTSAYLDYTRTDNRSSESVILSAQNADDVYRFSVHNFTDKDNAASDALSRSGAQVKVYCGDELTETYTVPANQTGTLWTVFELKNGTLNGISHLESQNNPDYIQ